MGLEECFETRPYIVVQTSGGSLEKLLDLRDSPAEELYISNVNRGELRGWKIHSRVEGRIFCIKGAVRFYIRETSSGPISIVDLSEYNPELLILRSQCIYAFESKVERSSLLNAASKYFENGECSSLEITATDLNYFEENKTF